MRVLYFSDGYGPHDHRFLAHLQASGLEVFFLRRQPGPVAESRPVPDGVRLLDPLDSGDGRRRRLGVALVDRLQAILDAVRPDVVHAGPVQRCAWLVAQTGFPRLATMSWGSDLLDEARFGLGRHLAREALARTAVFLGDCDAVRRSAIRFGVDPRRIVIFPWGVDLDRFRPSTSPETRRRLGWNGARVALCLRSWEPRYGVDTVLEAFLTAARDNPSLRLILAGDGPLRPWVIERVEASGLADRIWMPGYVAYDDLPTLYHTADVYVSASHCDGSSVSLLEALACGLPAFVSDIDGNREWVEPGENGELFAPGDAAGLARLLTAAATDHRAADLGRKGRAIAEARADWRRHAPQLVEAYAIALGGEL